MLIATVGAGHDAGQVVAAGLKVDVSKVVAMQRVEDIGKPAEDIGIKDARNVDVSIATIGAGHDAG